MHQFFGEFKAYRDELMRDPIVLPPDVTTEQFQWAVFCAASVEYLCAMYAFECPLWALDPSYTLAELWYRGLGASSERVQAKLRTITPAEFARRNIFCGNRIFNNKYEKNELERRRTA